MPVTISNRITLPVSSWGLQTSTVCEPTVAQLNDRILATGNWYAGASDDGGTNWTDLSPYTFFPAANGGFCCDQSTVADPGRGLMAWVLQYSRDDVENTLRIAVNRGGDFATGSWDLYDITPTMVDPQWQNEWFDYNHVTISTNCLYVVTNMFDFADRFTRCIVMRFSLDDLQDGSLSDYDLFIAPSRYFSLRATEGASDEMYFFAHKSTGTMTVFQWPESDAAPASFDVNITRWRRGTLSSTTPDGTDWIKRGDGRITAAWSSGGLIGALWMSNTVDGRPVPFVRAVCIDPKAQALVSEPDIWTESFSPGFPTAGVNSAGQVGLSFFYGGGPIFVNHGIGTIDLVTFRWSLRRAFGGTNGPADNKWGDYLSCRSDPNDNGGWISSGFTLNGGQGRRDIQPHIVYFS